MCSDSDSDDDDDDDDDDDVGAVGREGAMGVEGDGERETAPGSEASVLSVSLAITVHHFI